MTKTSEKTFAGKRVVITGGSGYLGRNLAAHLAERGAEVVVVSRHAPPNGPWRYSPWDGRSVGEWAATLDGAAAVVNLAGRSVDCVKTPDHCDEILRSRVESTRAVGRAMHDASTPPPVWVQMSTAHIYGDPPDVVCEEDSPPGYGLAPTVGKAWEAALAESVPAGVRTVLLRTSFVLGRGGGALPKLALLTRWGLGGKIASGKQGVSWIHESDMNRIFERAIEDERWAGVLIASAPHPVSNAEFMRALRRVLKRPVGLPAPGWGVRVAAPLLMRSDPELALYGRYCISRRLPELEFAFEFPELQRALADLLRDKSQR